MIKELRESKGLSQDNFAPLMRCAQAKLSKIESGKMRPSIGDLYHLHVNLALSIEEFEGMVDHYHETGD